METETISKNEASLKSQTSKGNFLRKIGFALFAVVFSLAFVACDNDDDDSSSSPFVGTWQSVGYYNSAINGMYYPETTKDPIPDTSEKITFNSNGKGVREIEDEKTEFKWKASEIAIEISMNSESDKHEYYLSSKKLVILWSAARQVVYEKK